MKITFLSLLNCPFEKVNKAFAEWHNHQTKSDDREDCFDQAFLKLGLSQDHENWPNTDAVPHIIKVHILYQWLTADRYIQGEEVTKESKDAIKAFL